MKHICYLLLAILLLCSISSYSQNQQLKPLFEKGWRQINGKELDSALQLADSILNVVSSADRDSRIRAMNIKSKALFQKGKSKESFALLFDALRLCKQPEDNKHVAYLYGEVGYLYYAQQHYTESKSYYYKQIDVLRTLYGTDSLADPFINLAIMHESLKEFDSAFQILNLVGGIVEHSSNLKQQGFYYLNRGALMQYTNKLDSAIYYYNKAYDAWNAIGYESQLYKTTFNIGYIAEQQKDYAKAIAYYKRTEAAVKKFGLKSEIAHVYGTMAEAYAEMKQYDSAYKYLFQYVVINDSVTQGEFNASLSKLDKQFQAEKSRETIRGQQLQLEQQHNKLLLIIIVLTVAVLGGIVVFGYLTFRRRVTEQVDEAKARFFANVVHEIRTPLSMIQGPVKVLQGKITDPEMRYQLDMADRNTNRLNDLVNQMLAIAKIDAAKYTLTESLGNPTTFIELIANEYKLQAIEQQQSLIFNGDADSRNALFDKDALEKITVNLISNAIKYTPQGGSIGVEVTKEDSNLTLTVWDTGTGISKSEHDKIFSRFYRTGQHKADGSKGTGIGLSLVKELVLLMGGSITVESELGKGAVFTVQLPLKHYEPLAAGTAIVNDEAPIILLVEDDADILDFNKTLLQSNGYNVVTAHNGNEATTLLLEDLPDLIITDVMMPEKDGLTLLKEIKANIATDHIPVIMLSAKAGAKIEGMSEGAQVYLNKPFLPAELLALVKNQLQLLQKQKNNIQPEAATSIETTTNKTIAERFAEADPFSKNCLEIIQKHIDDAQLSVEMLANLMHINRSHFQRKIKTLTGYSPSELIKTVRLDKALQMLRKKEGNITEIAYATGFTSQSYFTKCFSDYYGYPPSQVS